MKVNPVGIQAYEQLIQRDKPAQSKVESQVQKKDSNKVSITPQSELTKSQITVKIPKGNYTEFLSPQERQALELLFGKFRDSERFGASYNNNADLTQSAPKIGSIIDVKV